MLHLRFGDVCIFALAPYCRSPYRPDCRDCFSADARDLFIVRIIAHDRVGIVGLACLLVFDCKAHAMIDARLEPAALNVAMQAAELIVLQPQVHKTGGSQRIFDQVLMHLIIARIVLQPPEDDGLRIADLAGRDRRIMADQRRHAVGLSVEQIRKVRGVVFRHGNGGIGP